MWLNKLLNLYFTFFRLSAHICGYTYYQVEKTYGYDHKAFRNDLRNMYNMTGIENKKVVLLLSNAQVSLFQTIYNSK